MTTPHRIRLLSLAAATASLVAACGDDGTPSAAASPRVHGEELVGRWAHHDVVAYEDPLMKTQIISLGFTDFAVRDGRLVESEEFCTARQTSDQPIRTSISDAATRAIRPVSTPVEVSGVPGSLRVRRPATATPVGIRLDDPATDELPTDPDDPRVVDDDEDGRPGITVSVEIDGTFEGELYLARREIFSYDLVQDGADTLRGTVTDTSEQLVVGASDPLLETTDAQWEQVADRSHSPILLRRVDTDWDCERLAARQSELFPPAPPIDW